VWTSVVVLMFPASQFGGELGNRAKRCAAIEPVLVGPVTALDLAVALRASRRDMAMRDAEIVEVPGEVGPELSPVIGLNALDGDRQPLADLVDERDGVGDRRLAVDFQPQRGTGWPHRSR